MISKYSVKKPYTVLVGVLLVIVLGVVSLTRMTTDLLPDMSLQYAMVITMDMGASPEKVETDVTAPIEAAMATTSNIKNITSSSSNSYSMVVLEYAQNANMDSVVIEIQQKLDQLEGTWDDSVGTPMIMQINPDMMPVLTAAVDVDGMDASALSDYVDAELTPSLESLEGVASVNVTGQIEERIEVTLDQEKIDALNQKIHDEIDAQFVEPQNELDSGKNQVESGQSALDSGAQQMNEAYQQVLDQKEQLYKTESDLKTQLSELETQKEQLELVQNGISAFRESEDYSRLQVLDYSLTQLQALLDAIGGMNLPEDQIEALQAQLQTQLDTLQAQRAEADAAVAQNFAGLSAMGITVNGMDDLSSASAAVGTFLTQINTGIDTIETALEQIEAGKVTLAGALDTLNANAVLAAIQMGSSSAQLATAASSLESAQTSLDEAKNTAYESADLNEILTVQTLGGILTAQNFDMPAGYAYDGSTQYLVRVGKGVEKVEELDDLVLMDLGMEDVGIIRLSDVADIEVTDNSDDSYAIINGNPGIMLSMEKQTGYSTGDVTDRLLDRFETLEKETEGLHFSVLMDQGVYIDMIVDSVIQNMIVGAVLAIIVLFLFLKNIRPTIIIACSIPLSVIAAIVLMYFTGITLNIISMSGLVLGIGMLVDNSIVVIENIYRLRSEGYSIRKASVEGASQVAGAIVASTLTTVSVYAPIIFTEGITRQLFMDLALTIAFTLLASLAVALTFVPALSSAMLKKSREVRYPWFDAVKEFYGKCLAVCLRFKPIVFVAAVGMLVLSAAASLSRGMTFMDMDMETNQLSVSISAKDEESLTFDELTGCSDEVIEKISDIEGIQTIGAMAGGNSTMSLLGDGGDSVTMYIILDEDADVSVQNVEKEILSRTADMDCLVTTSASAMDFTAFFGEGLSLQIKGHDIQKLQELAAQTAELLEDVEGTQDIDDGLDNQTPQLSITVDKEKAAEYGYTVAQVFQLVYDKMADAASATTVTTDVKDYEVYVQTEEQSAAQLDDIRKLTFSWTDKEGNEKEVPLDEICTMEDTMTLSTISRDAQNRYLTVSCGIDEDHNVTLVSNEVKDRLKELDIPEGYSISMEGEDETINESMHQMMLMLVLSVVFIYLIMVAQFQSLVSPFIIMFSIPLAFTGGFLALFFSGYEVSIISMLGFIMLAGLIVNNGIVLIDYINQARREGMSKKDAIIDAGITRLRPILMTAMTTILAMSTSAVGIGEGSDMMKPMAITIIGGLVYGTLLTLIVIPCIYDAFNREKSMVEEEL